MKAALTLFFLFIVACVNAQMQFVAPYPGAEDQNPKRNIVIRPGDFLDSSTVRASLFSIVGSKSGIHNFKLVIARDGKTINLNLTSPFAFGETVYVNIAAGMKTTTGCENNGMSFSFYIHPEYTKDDISRINAALKSVREDGFENAAPSNSNAVTDSNSGNYYKILVNTHPAVGQIFFSNLSWFFTWDTQRYWIIDNNGDSIFSKPDNNIDQDWKLNHNGYLSSFMLDNYFQLYDSNYVPISKIEATNGYVTDEHELQLFPDGHYFLIADDVRIIDMTVYNPNYNSNAVVTGNVIQEFDADNNLLFEWNTFDHLYIPDAIHLNLAAGQIDAVHMNSIEQDTDGNIFISCRHLDQVDKIDLNTGNFIWRLGGVANQFAFINDSAQFNYQHDARRISNGDLTLFDNNNWGNPRLSSAKEYRLDEINKTATLVWQFSQPNSAGHMLSSSAMGSVQRLDNGDTFINWGAIPYDDDFPNITEVDSSNNIVWELRYQQKNWDVFYRAHKEQWNPCARPSDSKLKSSDITDHSAEVSWNAATGADSYTIQYRLQGNAFWNEIKLPGSDLSYILDELEAASIYEWQIKTWCDSSGITQSHFTAIKTFTTANAAGILSEAAKASLQLYPNPVSDVLMLRLPENMHEQRITVEILDEIGREVKAEEFFQNDSQPEIKLDVHSLPAGIYLIRLQMKQEELEGKFVKE